MPDKNPQKYRSGRDFPGLEQPPSGGALPRSGFGRDVTSEPIPPGEREVERAGRKGPATEDPLTIKKPSDPFGRT